MFKNIQLSGSKFDINDASWEFKLKILNTILLIAVFFAFFFALLHDLNISYIGDTQSNVNYLYSLSSLILFFMLRHSKQLYKAVATAFLIVSFCTFLSILVFVLNDELRIIWFYFLIYISYIFLGSTVGFVMTVATLSAILISNSLINLNLSNTATYTAIFGLIVGSLLSRAYTMQMERYEDALKAKNKQLEDNVNELDDLLEQTQKASKTKSLFLANMSHEIRTPMNGVLGMVQVLRGTTLNEAQKHYLQTLDSSSRNLLLLIDDLLDLSKIESGKLALDIETFETFSWITDIHNLTEPFFEDKNVIFTTDIDDRLPEHLKGDASRLLQITVNLISNASKYTQLGDVQLSVGGQLAENGMFNLEISVNDTGSGIAENKLEGIFEAFHQVEYDRTTNKGVGLGLSICKHLCDSMKGKLEVTSKPGLGSCFTFNVSLAVAEKPQSLSVKNDTDENTASLSVLLVDDEVVNRMATRTLLTQRGHRVSEAENGQIAINKVETEAFDVILMDIHMPVLGGIEATTEIRNNRLIKSQPPIIGLTASVMSNERQRYIEAGMNAVVEKPVMIDKLIKSIQKQL